MVLPNLREHYVKGKHRGDISDALRNIRFIILDWCHFCYQGWCNLAENNSDFLYVYVGGLWVSSGTTRALEFHFMLGGCSFLFQTVIAKIFLLLELRKVISVTFFKEKCGKHIVL